MKFDDFVDTHSETDPERPAVVSRDSTATYADLARRIRTLPRFPDQVVALRISDPVDYVAAFVGSLSGNSRVLPIPVTMPKQAYAEVITATKARLITGLSYSNLRIGSTAREGSVLHFTSGSTGARKIAVRSAYNLLDEALAVATRMLMKPTSRVLITSPLEHSYGCGVMRAAIMAGATIFSASDLLRTGRISELKWLCSEWATIITGVPYMFRILTRTGSFSTPAESYSGGEALPHDIRERWRGTLFQEYGLSESGIVSTGTLDSPPDAIGKPVPRVKIELDEDGEMIVSRPHAPSSYLFGESPETWTEGGCRTGDIAEKVIGGSFRIIGRKKDMINVGGHKVVPREVEDALTEHPDITDAIVMAVNKEYTERPVAFILSSSALELADVRTFLRTRLASYKLPIRLMNVASGDGDWPRNATGKVDREALRASL